MPRNRNSSTKVKSQQISAEPMMLGGSVIFAESGGLNGLLILQTNDGLTPLLIDAESAETLREELDKFLKGQCPTMVEVEPEAWTNWTLLIYRAYLFDKDDLVSSVHVVQAEDDRGAVEEAAELAERNDVEIWDGLRLVVRLGNRSKTSG